MGERSAYNTHCKKGVGLALRDIHEDAIRHFDAAICINPDLYYAYYLKGESLPALDRHEEAMSAWTGRWLSIQKIYWCVIPEVPA